MYSKTDFVTFSQEEDTWLLQKTIWTATQYANYTVIIFPVSQKAQ